METSAYFDEATALAKCIIDLFYGDDSNQWYRGADIYRREDGEYRLISSGCGINGIHHVVIRNVSLDLYGDIDESTTVEDLATMLTENKWLGWLDSDGNLVDDEDEE